MSRRIILKITARTSVDWIDPAGAASRLGVGPVRIEVTEHWCHTREIRTPNFLGLPSFLWTREANGVTRVN
jgi:hypothetical protein